MIVVYLQAANSLALGTSPIVRSLVDPEGGMQAVRNLDNISFADWFRSHGGSQGSIDRMWDPIGKVHCLPGVLYSGFRVGNKPQLPMSRI